MDRNTVTSSPESIRGHPPRFAAKAAHQADARKEHLRFGSWSIPFGTDGLRPLFTEWTVCHSGWNDKTTGRATRPLLPFKVP